MNEYFVSYNEYFGFCVVKMYHGTGEIVFTGTIPECNKKCMELNEGERWY